MMTKRRLPSYNSLAQSLQHKPRDSITIISKGINPISSSINCGESGLSARLFAPIAALSNRPINIEGNGSLLHRPMQLLNDILPALNVSLPGFSGHIPFTVSGPLQPASIRLDGSISSQFISGILFALSYSATEPVTITVDNLKSKPYIDLTLDILSRFGKPIQHNDHKTFHIDPATFHTPATVEIIVEGDWSSAAFFLVAGAIAGNVTVNNLNVSSKHRPTLRSFSYSQILARTLP